GRGTGCVGARARRRAAAGPLRWAAAGPWPGPGRGSRRLRPCSAGSWSRRWPGRHDDAPGALRLRGRARADAWSPLGERHNAAPAGRYSAKAIVAARGTQRTNGLYERTPLPGYSTARQTLLDRSGPRPRRPRPLEPGERPFDPARTGTRGQPPGSVFRAARPGRGSRGEWAA